MISNVSDRELRQELKGGLMLQQSVFDFNDLDTFARIGFPHHLATPLRQADPIHWHDVSGDPFWLILRHADVISVSRNWRVFSSTNEHGGIHGLNEYQRRRKLDNLGENVFATMDPPEHSKYRGLVSKAMMPSAVRRVSDRVQEVSVARIAEALEKDICDFVVDVSQWIPLEAIAELGNIPNTNRQDVFRWVNAMLGPDEPEYSATVSAGPEGRRSLQKLCEAIYEERKVDPNDDIISMMIQAEVDGTRVTAPQCVAFFQLLISAGSETTRTTMSHGVLALTQNPEQYEAMRADESLIPQAIEEMLRWSTPVHYMRRGVTDDIEIGGKQMRRGDSVILCYPSANRDEGVFEDPFTFDIFRKSNPHISFGGNGPHTCLGANLARMEMKVFFTEFCRRVKRIELAGIPGYLRSNQMNGIKHLPLRLLAA
jgi:cholest-4-en-3-one 26-monooxygenase